AGSLRLRVPRETCEAHPPSTRRRTFAAKENDDAPANSARSVTVVIEKGAPYQTVKVFSRGDVDRDIEVARRVRTHSEVPDRRGVVRTQRIAPPGAPLGHAADRAGGERETAADTG